MIKRYFTGLNTCHRKLVAFLKSEDCMAQLRYWTPSDCPPPDTRNVKNVVKEAASKFAERLTLLVDDWEYNNNQVSRIKSSIIKSFQRRLELFEDQLKKIESRFERFCAVNGFQEKVAI